MKTTKQCHDARKPGGGLMRTISVLSILLLWCPIALSQDAKIVSRPLTPQEIKNYELPAETQISPGLLTVGAGTAVYLEALVPEGTVVTGLVWALTKKPGSSAATLVDSPLGEGIPIYTPGDRSVYDIAGRTMLVPDVVGDYTVTATAMDANGELILALTRDLNAANYVGAGHLENTTFTQCVTCHSDKVEGWMGTQHSTALIDKINGLESDHFSSHCVSCHSTGFNEAPTAVNGGFDDVATEVGWTFPETLDPGNWDAMPDKLKGLANIQCESCHGPGSEHKGNVNRIDVSFSAGDCGQCHDSEPYHNYIQQWSLSKHSATTQSPTGEGRTSCVGCHSAPGFVDRIDGVPVAERRTDYEAIVCAACHDPHSAENPHQLRSIADVTLMNGETIPGGGNGRICMNCHISRRDADTYVQQYSGHFGPHHGPQTDMLAGSNAVEYGKEIPSSSHFFAVKDSCATCHMQEVARGELGFNQVGGHTFKPAAHVMDENGAEVEVDLTSACANCHGPIDSHNIVREDFDGDGVREGVQDEVEGLMHKLAMMLPPLNEPTVEVVETYTPAQLKAAYNYLFVEEDGSHGVHNARYATGLLKASIEDLGGGGTPVGADSDADGLLDAWEIQYFGNITSQSGAGDPDGDGLSNTLEASVMTNPTLADSDGDGFDDFAELHLGYDPLNDQNNPELGRTEIYRAAEMVFLTEPGKMYQIQAIDKLGVGGWTNVGEPIEGGGMVQQFISTRITEKMFYRVVEAE
jgi:hypothetical protein